MLFGREVRRILVHRAPVDMRKSFAGLAAAAGVFGDTFSGAVFVFCSRSGRIIKLLWWDRTGWCVLGKNLERGRFEVGTKSELSVRELELLLDGVFSRRRVRS
jgi:transposase